MTRGRPPRRVRAATARALPFLSVALLVLAFPLAARAQEHAEEAAGGGAGGNPLFTFELGLSIWTIVVFLFLLWVLGKFAWRPILGALEAREERIEEAIAEATRMREEAAKLLEEQRKQLVQTREHAQQILVDSRQAAERLRRDMEDRARREGEEMLERARREIEREREKAVDALRREAVDLAMAAASRLLHRRLDSAADRDLVLEYLDAVKREEGGARA
ncbi:MAG: F0F1 ATP synthase subunit B [Gemmatimonadetes bacterium]|nr:F0F1 ATP synthase subunit B [Gemmatimonadota bacterium]